MRKGFAVIKFVILVLMIGILIALSKLDVLDLKAWLERVSGGGVFTFFVFTALFMIAFFLLFPVSAGTLLGAVFLPPFYNIACTYIAIIVVALVDFMIARYFGRDFIHKYLYPKKVEWLDNKIRKRGLKAAFLVLIFPLGSFASSSYLAGLSRMRLRHFILGTMIVRLPGRFIYTYATRLWLQHASMLSFKIIIAIILLAFFIGVPVYLWKKMKL